MQSLKDATVVLGLLLLLVSVKVAPLEPLGDLIPSAEAAPATTDGETAQADRIILRIDTRDGQAQIERLDIVEPTPTRSTRDEALEARKIG